MIKRDIIRVERATIIINCWSLFLIVAIFFYLLVSFGKGLSVPSHAYKTTDTLSRQIFTIILLASRFIIFMVNLMVLFEISDEKNIKNYDKSFKKYFLIFSVGVFFNIFDYFAGVPIYIGVTPLEPTFASFLLCTAWQVFLAMIWYFLCTRLDSSVWNTLKPIHNYSKQVELNRIEHKH